MILVCVLLALGLVLLAAELFVPGAVLGIVGGVLMLAGVIVAFVSFGDRVGFATLAIAFVAGVATVAIEFLVLPKTRFAKRLSMSATMSARTQAINVEPAVVVGQEAIADTKLVPSGYVTVGAKRYEAFCRDGAVDVGARLRVVGVDNFRLIVTHSHS